MATTKMSEETQQLGLKAEYHVIAELNEKGIPHDYIDSWYDILLRSPILHLEVKSSKLSVKNGRSKHNDTESRYRSGRFDLEPLESRQKLREANGWYCFVLRHKTRCLTLGFIPAKEIKDRRYLRTTELSRYKLREIEEMIAEKTERKDQ